MEFEVVKIEIWGTGIELWRAGIEFRGFKSEFWELRIEFWSVKYNFVGSATQQHRTIKSVMALRSPVQNYVIFILVLFWLG